MFKRDVYLKRLANRLNNGLIKIISGTRRAGKSFLLNNIFYNYLIEQGIKKENIIKFAFDQASDLELINVDIIATLKENKKIPYQNFISFIHKKIVNKEKYFLLLDEIQLLDGFEYVLNGFLSKDNLEIYVTGSNSKFLSKDIITEFRGRGDEIHILPLSFSEYYNGANLDKDIAWDNYITTGGLPIVQIMNTDEQKKNYLKNICNELYLKDILEHNKINKPELLKEIFDLLATYLANTINPLKLANTYKSKTNKVIDNETLNKYIAFFEDAFLISKSIRYDIKGKKYISTPYKIYFEDIGIRNARLNFRQIEESHLMENIIYNELRYRGFLVDTGSVMVNEPTNRKDKNNKIIYARKEYEVDFIASKGQQKYYIQCALSIDNLDKLTQETNSINNIPDSFKKIVIVKNNIKPRIDDKGIEYINLFDFLLSDYFN